MHFERGPEGLSRNLEKRDTVEKRYFQVCRHRHEYERDIERVEQRHADDEGGKQQDAAKDKRDADDVHARVALFLTVQDVDEHGAKREKAVQNHGDPGTWWASQKAVDEHDDDGQDDGDDSEAQVLSEGELLVEVGDLECTYLVVADGREDVRNGHTQRKQAGSVIASGKAHDQNGGQPLGGHVDQGSGGIPDHVGANG